MCLVPSNAGGPEGSNSCGRIQLPADLEAGSTTRAAANGATSTVAVGDDLDPQRILVLEVRRVAGLAQRIQAALLRTRGRSRESRQLEDHPRAAIHLRQGEKHRRPVGGHLDLGTGSYVARGLRVLPAIASENDWRLRSCAATAASTTRSARTGSCGWGSSCARSGRRGTGATGTRGAGT